MVMFNPSRVSPLCPKLQFRVVWATKKRRKVIPRRSTDTAAYQGADGCVCESFWSRIKFFFYPRHNNVSPTLAVWSLPYAHTDLIHDVKMLRYSEHP